MTLGIALPGTALGLWRNPVAALFSTGEQGAWYDPSDFSTMYQDSAGTTPVTAAGEPVGLILDKRLGAVRGAELVVPGDWATGAGVTNNAGVLTVNIAAGSIALIANQSEPMTSGGWYEFTGTISNYTSGALILFLGDAQATIFPAANGAFRTIFQAGASNVIQINCTAAGFVGTISGTSVKSVFGNHRTQATAASRPTLRQDASGYYYLEYDGVDDSMATGSVDFSGTSKITSFHGILKTSDANGFGIVLEMGNRSAALAGSMAVCAPATAGTGTYYLAVEGAAGSQGTQTASGFAAPSAAVLTSQCDVLATAAAQAIRVNGSPTSTVGGVNPAGTVFGNHPLYFGRRNNDTLPFTGREYQTIIRGAASSASQITQAERYVGSKMGIAL